MKKEHGKKSCRANGVFEFDDGFFIPTRDYKTAHTQFRRSLKKWKNLCIIGQRNSGKTTILDQLMRVALPSISVVFQSGIHPNLRREVSAQLVREISYLFKTSDKFILFLDEFDTFHELNRLCNQLKKYDYITVLASNNPNVINIFSSSYGVKLTNLTENESLIVLKKIAKRIHETGSSTKQNVANFLKWTHAPNNIQQLIEYSNGRPGAFIMLATELLLLGPPYEINQIINQSADQTHKGITRSIQKIIKVSEDGYINIVNRELIWVRRILT